jgi:2,3-bisphosphoglycerate-independent phosphoglycerate mutase
MSKSTKQIAPNSLMLLILDGWGLCDDCTDNPIRDKAPYYASLLDKYEWMAIDASGEAVGLPQGQMGNSEVGHFTLGTGRVVYQSLTRIDKAIESGEFNSNKVLLDAIEHANNNDTTLHLMGLVSPGGVHSHEDHLIALIDLAKAKGVKKVNVHAFLDGRDVAPKSAHGSLQKIEEHLLELDYPQIQTLAGRYYAMDRDKRWERTQKAYDNLVLANGRRHFLSTKALATYYHNDVTDEFIDPCVTDLQYQGIEDNDAVIFFNFRPDRARQLTMALTYGNIFKGWERKRIPQNLHMATMANYDDKFTLPVAFPKQEPKNTLPEVLSKAGLNQFRCAETEKYAHVTYFFNGGQETPLEGEFRRLINSPKVATYDEQPEMSLPKVTETILEAIESDKYHVLIANFANPDMVGHTGILGAAQEAVDVVDKSIRQVAEAILAKGGTLLLTADHGNIEQMTRADGGPHTAHTTNLVPLIAITNREDVALDHSMEAIAGLSHVAPTMLSYLSLPIPEEMDASLAKQAAMI